MGKWEYFLDNQKSTTCKRSAFIWRVYLVGLSVPSLPPPPSCSGVKPELLCPKQLSCCVFYSCASVIMMQPGRELLSSFALPMETWPCESRRMKRLLWLLRQQQGRTESWLKSHTASVQREQGLDLAQTQLFIIFWRYRRCGILGYIPWTLRCV